MSTLFSRFEWLSRCTGIELHFEEADRCTLRSVAVELKGKELGIGEKKEVTGTPDEVLKKSGVSGPSSLVLTGRGVLVRKVNQEIAAGKTAIDQVFPNLDTGQFYIQHFSSGNTAFVAIVRRSLIDELLSLCDTAGISILSVTLGPFALEQVMKQLNVYGPQLELAGHRIRFSPGGGWESYEADPGAHAPFPVKIGIEPVAEEFVIAYSSAFQLALYHRLDVVEVEVPQAKINLVRFHEDRKFKTRGAAVLVTSFVVLLVNFVVLTAYENSNKALLDRADTGAAGRQALEQVIGKTAGLETHLRDLGWNGGLRYAFICDRIGQTVPAQVTLTALAVNPSLSKKIPGISQPNDSGKTVRIAGIAGRSSAVNDWISRLRGQTWIDRVQLEKYAPSSRDGEGEEFSLLIRY